MVPDKLVRLFTIPPGPEGSELVRDTARKPGQFLVKIRLPGRRVELKTGAMPYMKQFDSIENVRKLR